ncbi:MAG: hypothetical protein ACRD4K_16565 [Candidatus Acidiferrales bacterium]
MRLTHEPEIEDARSHSPETIDTLRALLAGGARVLADPKRPNFYELEHGSEVFYIHLSPVSGNILLLATWSNEVAGITSQAA